MTFLRETKNRDNYKKIDLMALCNVNDNVYNKTAKKNF